MIKSKIESIIHNIAEILKGFETESISLLGDGLSSKLLFLAYYKKYFPNENTEIIIEDTIDKLLFLVENNVSLMTFCNGLTGFGWCLEHLRKMGIVDVDNVFFDELDDKVAEYCLREQAIGNYDYLHGSLGGLLYFLTNPYHNDRLSKIDTILTDLINSADFFSDSQVRWKDYHNTNLNKTPTYNFGLAHGIPSILFLMSKCHNLKGIKNKTENVIYQGINYLNEYKFNPFPYWVTDDLNQGISGNSRLAWCYGDLGAGYSIYKMGSFLHNSDLNNTGVDIITNTLLRRNESDTKVMDASLCHGSLGNSYIYFKLFRETKNKAFLQSFEFWLSDGLNRLKQHHLNTVGYGYWDDPSESFQNRVGILEGLSGIGLILLSFFSNEINTWDECILLN